MKAIDYFCKIKEVDGPVFTVEKCPDRYTPVKEAGLSRRTFIFRSRLFHKDKETLDEALLRTVLDEIVDYVEEKEIQISDLVKELSNIPKEMQGHKKVFLTNASQETIDKYQAAIDEHVSNVTFFKVEENIKDKEFFCLIDTEKKPVDIYIQNLDVNYKERTLGKKKLKTEDLFNAQVILNNSGNYKVFRIR